MAPAADRYNLPCGCGCGCGCGCRLVLVGTSGLRRPWMCRGKGGRASDGPGLAIMCSHVAVFVLAVLHAVVHKKKKKKTTSNVKVDPKNNSDPATRVCNCGACCRWWVQVARRLTTENLWDPARH